jgi:hypothetical protein
MRWLAWIIAIIALASPLPDELGVALLGASHLRLRWFIPVAFVANAIGILIICLAVRAV